MTTQKALDIIEQITTDFRATKPERQMIDQAMLMVSESLNLLDKIAKEDKKKEKEEKK